MHDPKLKRHALVGMIHLLPLPGSPFWSGSMDAVIEGALRDLERLEEGGCDAVIVENMGDAPYVPRQVAPETMAAISVVTARIVERSSVQVGLQILAAANQQALAVASVTGCAFIRAEGFAYAHVADEGWIDACAGDLLRARRAMGSQVKIWADVQKKHAAHAVTADLSMEDLARGAAFCGADALIVTGAHTGSPTDAEDITRAATSGLPVAVGSGLNEENIRALAEAGASALIVGSWIKQDGAWRKPVSLERVQRLRAALDR